MHRLRLTHAPAATADALAFALMLLSYRDIMLMSPDRQEHRWRSSFYPSWHAASVAGLDRIAWMTGLEEHHV
jgi:hypothetical protein